jgi:hypothetical protein
MLRNGDITLTNVSYVEVPIAAEAVGLSAEQIAGVAWCDDRWGSGDQVRVRAGAWVIRSGSECIVVDPLLAADDIFHEPNTAAVHRTNIASAFARDGVPIGSVTQVVMSHLEGIGLVAARSADEPDVFEPFFPNARIRLSQHCVDAVRSDPEPHWTVDVWRDLLANGHVDALGDHENLAAGVTVEHTGAHDVGHCVVHIDGATKATHLGHLALTPMHLDTGPCEGKHLDHHEAERLLRRFTDDGRLLLGGLWPPPGAGRYLDNHFVPASSNQTHERVP